jgi:hypothetical protein
VLEQVYNNGNPFPKVLKELLYLAGENCTVLALGGGGEDFFASIGWAIPTEAPTMQKMQKGVQWRLQNEGVSMPNRPWFVIDIYEGYEPIFIFLDEGDDPNIYQLIIVETVDDPAFPGNDHIRQVLSPLSAFINVGVKRMIRGENPF